MGYRNFFFLACFAVFSRFRSLAFRLLWTEKANYSEFLGLRIKAANHGSKQKPNYVVESHIKEKSIEKISECMKRLIHDIEFPGPGKRAEHAAVARFNAYVFSAHNYYDMATMVFQLLAEYLHDCGKRHY